MFRHQNFKFRTNNIDQGDVFCIASIQADDYVASGEPADTQVSQDIGSPDGGSVAPAERFMKIQGPVTVHGYSIRVYGNFLGAVYQGLSRRENEVVTGSNNDPSVDVHSWHASLSTESASGTNLTEEGAIKNLKYLKGWSYFVKEEFYDDILTDPESAAIGLAGSQSLGYTHLEQQLSRKSFSHKGGGNYAKKEKSGFVLVPNTGTEFMSWAVRHIGPQGGDAYDNRFMYVDASIWMSYDQQ